MMQWLFLLAGSYIASTISGIAGFGGSLVMLPIVSALLGAKRAIPVLTIAWLMGNLSRALLGWRDIRWKPVLLFSLGAVPSALAGARLFVELPASLILRAIGVFLILVVVFRHTSWNRPIPHHLLIVAGAVVGFLSAVIGSAGPVGAAAFLSLHLPPAVYVASEAVTAVVMHTTKVAIYRHYELLTADDTIMGLALGVAMAIGSWTARGLLHRVPEKWVLTFVEVLLVVAAVQLLLSS
jgi:hypothetical protein